MLKSKCTYIQLKTCFCGHWYHLGRISYICYSKELRCPLEKLIFWQKFESISGIKKKNQWGKKPEGWVVNSHLETGTLNRMPLCNLSMRQDFFNLNWNSLCSIFLGLADIEVRGLLWDELESLTYYPKFRCGLDFFFWNDERRDNKMKLLPLSFSTCKVKKKS